MSFIWIFMVRFECSSRQFFAQIHTWRKLMLFWLMDRTFLCIVYSQAVTHLSTNTTQCCVLLQWLDKKWCFQHDMALDILSPPPTQTHSSLQIKVPEIYLSFFSLTSLNHISGSIWNFGDTSVLQQCAEFHSVWLATQADSQSVSLAKGFKIHTLY